MGAAARRKTCGLLVGYTSLFVLARRAMNGNLVGAAKIAAAAVVLGKFIGGNFDTLASTLFGFNAAVPRVRGSCNPKFDKVKRAFEEEVALGLVLGSQLVVYHKGEKVVDLVGTYSHPTTVRYNSKTLQNVFSSSKVVTSIAFAILADRGHVEYTQKVSEIWPEFGANGKGDLTVADMMKHELGLAYLSAPLPAQDLTAARIKEGAVSAALANERPSWPKGTRRDYHAETRGFFVNEVFRRCDPKGRTVGEFVAEEMAGPLGVGDELYCGLPASADARVATLVQHSRLWALLHSCVPNAFGSLVSTPLLPFVFMHYGVLFGTLKKHGDSYGAFSDGGKAFSGGVIGVYNAEVTRRAEVPSANMHATANGLAAAAGIMVDAARGRSGMLSRKGLDAAMANPTALETFGPTKTTFTDGGFNVYGKDGLVPRFGFVGWQGYGGSVCQWQAEKELAVGYAVNGMEPDLDNRVSLRLQRLIAECAS